MTKRVRTLLIFFLFLASSTIGGAHFFLFLFSFPLFLKQTLTHKLYPVDEQFSDEKQFLIVQIQNL